MYIKPCISKSYNFILFDSTQYLYYQLLLVLKVQPSRAGAGRIEKLTFNEPSPPPPPPPDRLSFPILVFATHFVTLFMY